MITEKQIDEALARQAELNAERAKFNKLCRKHKRLTVKIGRGSGCQYLLSEADAANRHCDDVNGTLSIEPYRKTFSQSNKSRREWAKVLAALQREASDLAD